MPDRSDDSRTLVGWQKVGPLKSFLAVACTLALLALGSAVSAGAQAISFELDEQGRLVAVADAFGQITRYARDPVGRLLRLSYPDGRWNEYRYDAEGRLSELRTEQGRELRYRYDPQGRWSEVRFPNGDSQRFATTPDARGLSLTYPDGTVAAFRFDALGRLDRAETPLSSLTFRYDANERLETLLWAGGKAVSFRYDGENRVRALADAAGTERRDWEMTVRTAEAGRIVTVADALDELEIRRDEAGRLTSAASDWGWKAFLHWDTSAGQPRSMTGPWGYVELDSRGQPTEILTAQGGRITAGWDGFGRLERMSIPPLGDLRLEYGADRFPSTIDFGDGLRTKLRSEARNPESASRSEALRRRLLERESGIRLDYPMPVLSAERLFNAQGDRFWSRVASLVEASAKLSAPGTQQALARDDYWISGKYQTDPYYAELDRPTPDLSPENYLRMFALTVGITATDFGSFYLDVLPGINTWGSFVGGRGLLGVRRVLRESMVPLDRGDDVGPRLDKSGAALRDVAKPISWFHDLRELGTEILGRRQVLSWTAYVHEKEQTALTMLVMTEDKLVRVSSQRVVELRFLARGKAVVFDWLGAVLDGEVFTARKIAEHVLDEWLLGNFSGKHETSGSWKALSLRLESGTVKILSAIDLLARPPQVPGARSDEARSGVQILRRALEVDLAAVPMNRELEKRGRAIIKECPPGQVSCKGEPP